MVCNVRAVSTNGSCQHVLQVIGQRRLAGMRCRQMQQADIDPAGGTRVQPLMDCRKDRLPLAAE